MPRSPASLSGLYFDNNSSAVGLGSLTPLNNLTSVTIEAWVYLTGYSPNTARIFNFINGNSGFNLQLSPNSSTLIGQFGNGSTLGTLTNGTVPLYQWVHIASVWDGSNIHNYINGVQGGTATLAGGNTGTGLAPTIGNNATAGSGNRAPVGIISELRISNTARYTANFTPPTQPFTPDANTVGLYHLNESQGLVAQDSSSQANHGTLSGTPLPVWSTGKFIAGPSSRSAASNRKSIQNFNCSLSVNGSNQNVNIAPVSGLPIYSTSGYSVVGRFFLPRAPTGFNDVTLYGEGNSSSASQLFSVGLYNNNIGTFPRLNIKDNSGVTQLSGVLGNTKISIGAWHDFVWTDKNGVTALYIDGVLDTANFNYTPSTYTFNVCAISNLSSNGIRIWSLNANLCNFAAIPSGMSPLQALAFHQTGAIPVGAKGIWMLGEGTTNSTLYDSSGNGNNGTIVNSQLYTSNIPSKTRGLVGGNLVYNGNFEFAPPTNVAQTTAGNPVDGTSGGSSSNYNFGWQFKSQIAGSGSIQFDNSISRSGAYSLKVSTTAINSSTQASNNGPNSQTKNIPIVALPSTSYTVIFWMRTVANSGSAATGAQLQILERSGAGNSIGGAHALPGVLTTTGWTQYTLSFTTASTCAFLEILPSLIGNDGTGTLIMDAWFDDIVLTPTTNTTRSLAV